MAALLVAVPQSVWAQGAAGQAAPMSASTSAMVNLISLLIKQGTITPEKGMALLQQAETEAARAQGNIQQAANAAGVPTPVTAQTATADNPLPQPGEAPAGTVRVPYVPETVRKQIADQVRDEIMAKAKTEKWVSSSNSTPGWVRRVTVSGDIRVRSQSELQSRLNDNTLLDIARLSASSSPINTTETDLLALPLLDTQSNRYNRLKVRARLGVAANISPNVKVGIQIATGDDNSPISTNQKLAGGFAKRDIWLDKAYIELKPKDWIKTTLGRFDNPFLSTDLLFDDDLRFDGFSAEISADKLLPENFGLKLRGGAFPLDNGKPDYTYFQYFSDPANPTYVPAHRITPSRWLFSGQIEAGYRMGNGVEIKAAAAYYDFHGLQGQLSEDCKFSSITNALTGPDPVECSTDATRVAFPRKGNTLFYIRDISTPDGNFAKAERQYLGMIYKYRVLDFNASVTVPFSDTISATLYGDYVYNLAFKRSDECRVRSDGSLRGALTNVEATGASGSNNNGNPCAGTGILHSGNMGWLANLSVGYKKPSKWGEWRAMAGYRYLQTDAVPDAFPDSDFHLGGTNSKGYTIGAALGLTDGVVFSGKWMSANEVTGSPLSIDVLQFDLTAAF